MVLNLQGLLVLLSWGVAYRKGKDCPGGMFFPGAVWVGEGGMTMGRHQRRGGVPGVGVEGKITGPKI